MIGYDTIYAHQDVKDDARMGIKSTALLLGATSKPWLAGSYALALAGITGRRGWPVCGYLHLEPS